MRALPNSRPTREASATEVAKLKAALKAYEGDAAVPAGISQKADIGALQAEVDEQHGAAIAALRAEIAASQERQARQALHFHEELRRLGPSPSEGKSSEAESAPKKSLAERITAPRILRPAVSDAAGTGKAPKRRARAGRRPICAP